MQTIEPGDFEKQVFRRLIADVEGILNPSAEGMKAIRAFAVESGFDFFTPLENSPHPNVHRVSVTLLERIWAMANDVAENVIEALRLYIGENENFDADERREVLSRFLIDKKTFKEQNDVDYDDLSGADKAIMHLEFANDFIRNGFDDYLVDGEEDKNLSDDGEVIPDLCKNPELLGFVFVRMHVNELMTTYAVKLDHTEECQLKDILQEMRQDVVATVSRPLSNSAFKPLPRSDYIH